MSNRVLIALFVISAVLITVGCRRIESVGDTADLELHISTGNIDTKATLEEGEQFTNLLVVTKDANNTVQRKYVELSSSSDFTNVVFENLAAGECRVYAFANIGHTAWLANADDITKIKNGTVSIDPDQTLKVLSAPAVPSNVPDGTAMLLTGQQIVNVRIDVKNIGEVTLYRPVARLNVSLRNHTKKPITLNSLIFSKFNADRTYLLPRLGSAGIPEVPTETEYGPFPSLPNADLEVAAGNSETVYSKLLYENLSDDEYRVMADVTLDGTQLSLGSCLHFKVNWSNKSVTVTQTDAAPTGSNPNAERWLCYGDTVLGMWKTADNIYEITVDFGASLGTVSSTGFRIRENTNIWWGANDTNNHLTQGTPYSLKKSGSAPNITFTGGALLRTIDPETSQVTPITYIRRNQDLTVVLNVYHEVATANFNIEVVTEWTGSESEHLFK